MKRAAGKIATTTVLILGILGVAAPIAAAAEEFGEYGIESVSASLSTPQAGAHADLTIGFTLIHNNKSEPYALTRNIDVVLPPGVAGNPQAVPPCTVAEFGTRPEASKCSQDSQIGITEVTLVEPTPTTLIEPIYNMEAPASGDSVARFGFFAAGYPTFINVTIDPSDYRLIAKVEGAASAAQLVAASTTLWGVPASPSHNALRLTPQEAREHKVPAEGRKPGLPERPFLSNPTDCSTQRQITIRATSYQLPDSPVEKSEAFPEITGCGKVDFSPHFSAVPTNPEAAAPTGLEAQLVIPQNESPNGLATSTLKSAIVTLPEGLTINPSAGDGLDSCSADQVGFGREEASHCPDAAKIGSAEIEVPALAHTLKGSVYQRTPEPGHLFRFWLVTDEQGVHLKLPAEIEANPLTGQLTTHFAGVPALGGNPQFPVSALKLAIFGGPRAPLSTPASCGTYQTHYSFAPWSGRAPAEADTPMQITQGCNKGGFSPGLSAGTRSLRAGSFSPFVLTLTRVDGEANPSVLSVTLPEGLLAKLGGAPLCPDAQAASGACPAGSRIGSVTAATGVGGAPLWIPQPGKAPTALYLGGPYKGAPYSAVAVVPAQAGPFDLGTVVTRSALSIDPATAVATITTDPLPQILEGVPISYRTLHVSVDRPEFTLNPTNCGAMATSSTITAVQGQSAHPRSPFQATNCAKLAFAPKLSLALKGAMGRTGNPSVTALLTQGPGQAGIAQATTILPPSEFIDNTHINNPCTRVQFNAGACPASSILGHAKAISPLLDQPLEGPLYFRSNGGERELPDLVADLNGPVHIILVGFIDSVKKKGAGISQVRTRFAAVPDAPVSRFELRLFGGKRGLLENSQNLCKKKRHLKLRLTGQNGRVENTNPPLATSCGARSDRR
jgi:hypothetical protein